MLGRGGQKEKGNKGRRAETAGRGSGGEIILLHIRARVCSCVSACVYLFVCVCLRMYVCVSVCIMCVSLCASLCVVRSSWRKRRVGVHPLVSLKGTSLSIPVVSVEMTDPERGTA